MGDEPHNQRPRIPLILASLGSLVLLVIFGWFQAIKLPLMDMKAQWLWVVLLPVLIILIVGKYIGTFEAAGIKIAAPPDVPTGPPQPPSGVAASSSAAVAPKAAISVQMGAYTVRSGASEPWTKARQAEYDRTNKLFLVHVYQPSSVAGQDYDITIFLLRHISGRTSNQTVDFTEVKEIDLYFGPSWNDVVYSVPNKGDALGIRISAWGSFLAVARVVFHEDREPLILHRYIDFEMAPRKA